MPWTCRLIDIEAVRKSLAPGQFLNEVLQPGDMWFAPWLTSQLSPEYLADWQNKRAPLVVHLPDGSDWVIDGIAKNLNGHGWKTTGTAPAITARPSIGKYANDGVTFTYHGFLTDGVLSDDLDGRRF